MKYTPTKPAFAAAALLWLATTPNALAEPSAGDQRIRKLMNFEPTFGTVFLEVNLAEHEKPGLKHCNEIHVRIKSDTGVINDLSVQYSRLLFGKIVDGATYGGTIVLPAGVHTIASINCQDVVSLLGPFATFTLQAGQTLNLGNLQVLYKLDSFKLFDRPDNKGDWRVADLSPIAAASIARRWPETFAKAKKQYMTATRERPK